MDQRAVELIHIVESISNNLLFVTTTWQKSKVDKDDLAVQSLLVAKYALNLATSC
jgi:hypothetical protein